MIPPRQAMSTTSQVTKYESTHMLNGKPAGFAGFFATREEAEALRKTSKLPIKIKRVRVEV